MRKLLRFPLWTNTCMENKMRFLFVIFPAVAVNLVCWAMIAAMAEGTACKDAGGSYEKDGTYTVVLVDIVPHKVEGYHCVMPEDEEHNGE